MIDLKSVRGAAPSRKTCAQFSGGVSVAWTFLGIPFDPSEIGKTIQLASSLNLDLERKPHTIANFRTSTKEIVHIKHRVKCGNDGGCPDWIKDETNKRVYSISQQLQGSLGTTTCIIIKLLFWTWHEIQKIDRYRSRRFKALNHTAVCLSKPVW